MTRPAALPPAPPPPSPLTRGEAGAATIETAIAVPVVLLLVFGSLQGALWYHARNVALAAATQGMETARVTTGSSTAGRAAAASFVAAAGGADVLTGLTVTASRASAQASITVTGQSISVLPGVPGPAVSQTVTGPVERFTSGANP